MEGQIAALRFLLVKTLRRAYMSEQIPFPNCHNRRPAVLSQQEVTRLIVCSASLMHRAMIMTLYATGLRCAELCRLMVSDMDSDAWCCAFQQARAGVTAMFR